MNTIGTHHVMIIKSRNQILSLHQRFCEKWKVYIKFDFYPRLLHMHNTHCSTVTWLSLSLINCRKLNLERPWRVCIATIAGIVHNQCLLQCKGKEQEELDLDTIIRLEREREQAKDATKEPTEACTTKD